MSTRRIWMVIGIIVGGIIVLNLLARGLDQAVGGTLRNHSVQRSQAAAGVTFTVFGCAFIELLSDAIHDVPVLAKCGAARQCKCRIHQLEVSELAVAHVGEDIA